MALPRIPRGHEPETPEEKILYNKHSCPPADGGDNPDPVPPTVTLERDLLVNFDMDLPDGRRVEIWTIRDPDDSDSDRQFPSKAIRVTEGDVVRVRVGASGNTHTIHWHGIEPTPINDGVGKHSFEVNGNFDYQWLASHAGTYFYHCHVNTPLHFEMGLYGLLIVDPPKPAGAPGPSAPYPDGGPGFAGYRDGVIPYDVEAFWVADEFDTRWHELGHAAFMQQCDHDDPVNPENFSRDGFLNDFRPDVFLITGVPRANDATPITDPRVAITAAAGQTILLRILNAGYTVQRFIIEGLDAEVIGTDGRVLGAPPDNIYSQPFVQPAGVPISLTSARRWDLLIRPRQPGVFPARVEFYDWVSGELLGIARTRITVT